MPTQSGESASVIVAVYVLFFLTAGAVHPVVQLKESVVLRVALDFAIAGGRLAAVV